MPEQPFLTTTILQCPNKSLYHVQKVELGATKPYSCTLVFTWGPVPWTISTEKIKPPLKSTLHVLPSLNSWHHRHLVGCSASEVYRRWFFLAKAEAEGSQNFGRVCILLWIVERQKIMDICSGKIILRDTFLMRCFECSVTTILYLLYLHYDF